MNRLKNVWLIALFLCVVSCNASASTEGGNDAEPAKKEAPAKGEVIVLTKAEFLEKVFNYEKHPNEWVYEGSKPCIVDFYADWCGPCKQVAPILRDLAILYKKDIIVYRSMWIKKRSWRQPLASKASRLSFLSRKRASR